MPPIGPAPPRVSRETRLLLVTALVSLIALWALARVRFPDRPVSPLPPVLTQLALRSPFEEIPALIAELTPRLAVSVVPVAVKDVRHAVGALPRRAVAGLRVGDDLAVILLGDDVAVRGRVPIVARDPASGVALVRVRPQSVPEPPSWAPRRLDLPRYLVAADVVEDIVSFRPVFVGPLLAVPSAVWGDTVWLVPVRTDVVPGDLVFSTEGAFAGLVVSHESRPAIVPAQRVLALADRLKGDPPGPASHVGVHVQPMTEAIGRATGAPFGVVVVHVAPDGPAASRLEVTDVIETADGSPITSTDAWRAHVARLAPGATVDLRVRRAGAVRQVELTAGAPHDLPRDLPHGLTMRTVAGVGIEVLRVDAGSSAALAGIEPGDVITAFNGLRAPGAAQLSRAFASAAEDRPILVAITRDEMHRVVTMNRSR